MKAHNPTFAHSVKFAEIGSSVVTVNSIFMDAEDGKLKLKKSNGELQEL